MAQLVAVFCWCGRSIVHVPWDVVDRCETGECSAGCKRRFEQYGVRFELAGRPLRAGVNGHSVNCGCSPECLDNRRAYNRSRAKRVS